MGFRDKIDGTTVNTFLVGDGVAGDKYIRVDTGATDLPGLRRLNSTGYWEYSNDGTVWYPFINSSNVSTKPIINVGNLLTIGEGIKVLANDYPAIELNAAKTWFGVWSGTWPSTPTSDVVLKVKFILKVTGTGTKVRAAIKLKGIATGEDSSKAFDSSQFAVVTVSTATIGQVFEGSITFSASLFSSGKIITLWIGRDGANLLGAGVNDDFDKPIQIIGVEVA